MAVSKVYNGSSWVTGVMKIWSGSVWVAKAAYYNGSAWVELYVTGPLVGLAYTNNVTDRSGTCQANIRLHNDGDCYKSTSTGGYGTKFETWLDSGLNTEVWVERTISTGSLNTDGIGASRVALSTTRTIGVTQVSVGTKTATGNFLFYDASSGGNLLETTAWRCKAERY